ncbi:hypothetical protein ACFQU3_10680 [Terrabacter sp. GCM10028922]|uniref:hypothetical protein n=1 Tax=Terrabacter sp. GCM10028922 TaxID=3273428 RepID=UPI00361C9EB7
MNEPEGEGSARATDHAPDQADQELDAAQDDANTIEAEARLRAAQILADAHEEAGALFAAQTYVVRTLMAAALAGRRDVGYFRPHLEHEPDPEVNPEVTAAQAALASFAEGQRRVGHQLADRLQFLMRMDPEVIAVRSSVDQLARWALIPFREADEIKARLDEAASHNALFRDFGTATRGLSSDIGTAARGWAKSAEPGRSAAKPKRPAASVKEPAGIEPAGDSPHELPQATPAELEELRQLHALIDEMRKENPSIERQGI